MTICPQSAPEFEPHEPHEAHEAHEPHECGRPCLHPLGLRLPRSNENDSKLFPSHQTGLHKLEIHFCSEEMMVINSPTPPPPRGNPAGNSGRIRTHLVRGLTYRGSESQLSIIGPAQ